MDEPQWQGPVVVGADGSPASLRAVAWAAAEAVRQRAELRIVHAIGATEFFPGGAMSPSTELYGLLERTSARPSRRWARSTCCAATSRRTWWS